MNIERIKEELARTYVKIEKLQKKARDLEEQKKQAEDMEYLKIIRSNGVSAEELQLMIDISKDCGIVFRTRTRLFVSTGI